MGNAFLHGSSGGTSLNFKIIPYATEEALLAATPAANTIGVITETKITSWVFSPSEPAEPVEGMLWICTGKSGTVAINALKKNGIVLYPLYVCQYISGQWVRVDARVYQNGWQGLFDGLIYENGTYYTEHTNYLVPDTATIADGTGSIELSTVAKEVSEVYKVFGPVPLDDINTLAMTSAFTDSVANGSHRRVLFVASAPDVGVDEAEAVEAVSVTSGYATETIITLDVSSLTGEYYVYAGTNTDGETWNSARKLSITKIIGTDDSELSAKAAAYDILTEGVTE